MFFAIPPIYKNVKSRESGICKIYEHVNTTHKHSNKSYFESRLRGKTFFQLPQNVLLLNRFHDINNKMMETFSKNITIHHPYLLYFVYF